MKIKGFKSWRFFNERLGIQLYFPSMTIDKYEQYLNIPVVIRVNRKKGLFQIGGAFIFGIGIQWDENSYVEDKKD